MTEGLEGYRSVVTVDSVIFGFDEGLLKILLIERGEEPYTGQMALPGHFVGENEDLDSAAERVLFELTGLNKIYIEQYHTFGKVDRHPDARTITTAYFALIKVKKKVLTPQSATARNAGWYPLSELPQLAFDHQEIVEMAHRKIQRKIRYEPIGFELLPDKFTLSQLQRLYEAVLEKTIDKRNFRKKILALGLLVELDEKQKNVSHRAARLYRFNKRKYNNLKKKGFDFGNL